MKLEKFGGSDKGGKGGGLNEGCVLKKENGKRIGKWEGNRRMIQRNNENKNERKMRE